MSLPHAILSSLLGQKQTGYDLSRYFANNIADFWQASHQQIYQQLRTLKEKGYLESEELSQIGKPNRIEYQVTKSGADELRRWVMEETPSRRIKDVLLIKLYSLNEENAHHFYEELKVKKNEKQEKLNWLYHVREKSFQHVDELPADRRGIYLVMLAGISEAEQFISWCEQCLANLSAWYRIKEPTR